MTSNRFLWVAVLVLAGLTGCAMCDNSQDGTYPAFGGKWQRDNPVSGRVGSLFDPAGVQVTDQVTLSEAEPTLAEPETAEDAKPAERAKPAADQDAPDAGLKLPAMPFETPQKEEPKEGGTNLLPPLELPPAP